jgi:hypothetical protein
MQQRAAALGAQLRAEDGVATAVGWINAIIQRSLPVFAKS